MGSNRRGKFEIISEMLSLAMNKVGKTALLYGANLNHSRVNKYLELLKQKDFIEEIRESPIKYKTTKKGINFLEQYHDLKREFE